MKVRIQYKTPDLAVDETFSGRDAEAVVAAMKQKVASELNFALRMVVSAMTPLAFAQEVVKRYNDALKKALPRPQSCAEFLRQGEAEGIVTVVES